MARYLNAEGLTMLSIVLSGILTSCSQVDRDQWSPDDVTEIVTIEYTSSGPAPYMASLSVREARSGGLMCLDNRKVGCKKVTASDIAMITSILASTAFQDELKEVEELDLGTKYADTESIWIMIDDSDVAIPIPEFPQVPLSVAEFLRALDKIARSRFHEGYDLVLVPASSIE